MPDGSGMDCGTPEPEDPPGSATIAEAEVIVLPVTSISVVSISGIEAARLGWFSFRI